MQIPHRVIALPAGLPEAELVNLDAMKQFLRMDPSNKLDDEMIKSLLVAARQHAERVTWLSLCKKKYVQYMSGFPRRYGMRFGSPHVRHHDDPQAIKLYYPPLVEVEKIVYIALDGSEATLNAGNDFQVDYASEPGVVAPLYQRQWPLTLPVENAVRIFYTAGYEVLASTRSASEAAAPPTVDEPEADIVADPPAQVTQIMVDRSVPETLVTAVKQLVSHWYYNRIPVIAGAGSGGHFQPLPIHVQQTLDQHRCLDFCMHGD